MDYIIVKKSIKNMYIQIKDGKVYVRVPKRMTQKEIEKLIKDKEKWINKHLNVQKEKNEDNEKYIELLGEKYEINIINSNRDCIEIKDEKAYIYISKDSTEKREKLIKNLYKKCALTQYTKTTQKMMELTGLAPDSWKIRDIHSAWGSCSSKRNITLSLNLIKKREELIEYVVIHELCHLKHMNHSKEFWSLVEKYVPNYKECRKELKR